MAREKNQKECIKSASFLLTTSIRLSWIRLSVVLSLLLIKPSPDDSYYRRQQNTPREKETLLLFNHTGIHTHKVQSLKLQSAHTIDHLQETALYSHSSHECDSRLTFINCNFVFFLLKGEDELALANPPENLHWKCIHKCRYVCKKANVLLICNRSDISERKANIRYILLWEQSSKSLNRQQ